MKLSITKRLLQIDQLNCFLWTQLQSEQRLHSSVSRPHIRLNVSRLLISDIPRLSSSAAVSPCFSFFSSLVLQLVVSDPVHELWNKLSLFGLVHQRQEHELTSEFWINGGFHVCLRTGGSERKDEVKREKGTDGGSSVHRATCYQSTGEL